MAQTINDFKRPDTQLVKQYTKVAQCYSASCVFADVQRRQGVMHSSIKPIFNGTLVGPALTVKLSTGDLQDCLNALPVAQAGDVIVVDAGGDTETSIWGGLMGGLCLQKGVTGAIGSGFRSMNQRRHPKSGDGPRRSSLADGDESLFDILVIGDGADGADNKAAGANGIDVMNRVDHASQVRTVVAGQIDHRRTGFEAGHRGAGPFINAVQLGHLASDGIVDRQIVDPGLGIIHVSYDALPIDDHHAFVEIVEDGEQGDIPGIDVGKNALRDQ